MSSPRARWFCQAASARIFCRPALGILGDTVGRVKVAVSIPDPLFEAADDLARSRKVSRSQLYARALERLLAAEDDTEITSRLDSVYGAPPAGEETVPRPRVIAVRESW